MRDTDYAFGVAKIRYNELSLLSQQETEQLITADSVDAVLRMLSDKGWNVPENGSDCSLMLEQETKKAWTLLNEAAPDISVLHALIMPEDFHNLKAVLKCLVANESTKGLFSEPSITPPKLIEEAIREKRFDLLPAHLREAAISGYEVATLSHGAGMLIDITVDKYSMEERIKVAENSGVRVLIDIARLSCASADIKIAVRSAETGKDAEFMRRAMAESGLIDNERLIESAQKGRADITSYLNGTSLSGASESLKKGNASFEKWCDEAVFEKTSVEKGAAFGAGPLASYYMTKQTEIKNVRIIISAKNNNLSEEVIRERVRKAYV